MNSNFDELAKGLAHSVTPRAALNGGASKPKCLSAPFWAHLETATAGPRTVPVRSSMAGGKAQECSRPPRPSDVLRAGTARAPVGVSRGAPPFSSKSPIWHEQTRLEEART